MRTETVETIEKWLNEAFELPRPHGIIAFNVNLYDTPFRAEIVGSARYDPIDPDWACDAEWEAPKALEFAGAICRAPWEERLATCHKALMRVAEGDSPAAGLLRQARAVSVGFVDGDLELVCERTS